MITLSLDKCPHCHKLDVSGTVLDIFFPPVTNGYFYIFGHCNNCFVGVVGKAMLQYSQRHPGSIDYYDIKTAEDERKTYKGNISKANFIKSECKIRWYPEPQMPAAPKNVPHNIGRKFLEAEIIFLQDGLHDSAGTAYRKTLEWALDELSPETIDKRLIDRINKLKDDGLLVESMAQFAHSIRILGNGATHGRDEMSKADVANLRLFTEMFLTYTFTLPAMIPEKLKKVAVS